MKDVWAWFADGGSFMAALGIVAVTFVQNAPQDHRRAIERHGHHLVNVRQLGLEKVWIGELPRLVLPTDGLVPDTYPCLVAQVKKAYVLGIVAPLCQGRRQHS